MKSKDELYEWDSGGVIFMWIFGYGSLVWKADFPYEQKLFGYVVNYGRRFWQSSPDHRGTPDLGGGILAAVQPPSPHIGEQPGRTVTLVPSAGDRVWGAAYRLADSEVARVRRQLDEREKAGYALLPIDFYPAGPAVPEDGPAACGTPLPAHVYVNSGEQHFLGPQAVADIAERAAVAAGASGSNADYVLRLAACMRQLGARDALDEHLAQVEAALLEACERRGLRFPVMDEFGL